ncbi:MAG: DNA mismatch repair endonuclease MutH [Myxococcota bacterium]
MSPSLSLRPTEPPGTLEELLARSHRLAGLTLGQLANALEEPFPEDLGRHKGYVGKLLEIALGTTASTRPLPDFEALGVELKTLPVDRSGRPRESTFVCTASLTHLADETWATSKVRQKLARVLYVLIESEPSLQAKDRRVGVAVFAPLDEQEERVLRADWEDLAALIADGLADAISARRGVALQVRPKAANARVRRRAHDGEGELFATLPRGFYLRRSFTEAAIHKRLLALTSPPMAR